MDSRTSSSKFGHSEAPAPGPSSTSKSGFPSDLGPADETDSDLENASSITGLGDSVTEEQVNKAIDEMAGGRRAVPNPEYMDDLSITGLGDSVDEEQVNKAIDEMAGGRRAAPNPEYMDDLSITGLGDSVDEEQVNKAIDEMAGGRRAVPNPEYMDDLSITGLGDSVDEEQVNKAIDEMAGGKRAVPNPEYMDDLTITGLGDGVNGEQVNTAIGDIAVERRAVRNPNSSAIDLPTSSSFAKKRKVQKELPSDHSPINKPARGRDVIPNSGKYTSSEQADKMAGGKRAVANPEYMDDLPSTGLGDGVDEEEVNTAIDDMAVGRRAVRNPGSAAIDLPTSSSFTKKRKVQQELPSDHSPINETARGRGAIPNSGKYTSSEDVDETEAIPINHKKLLLRRSLEDHLLFTQKKNFGKRAITRVYNRMNAFIEVFLDKLCSETTGKFQMFSYKELEAALKAEGLIGDMNHELLMNFMTMMSSAEYEKLQGILIPKDGEDDISHT